MSPKPQYFSHNGIVQKSVADHDAYANRAFRLGDGFFETVRIASGRVLNWNAHYARIRACCTILHIDIPTTLSASSLLASLHDLIAAEEIERGGCLRITFYRSGQGTYLPNSNQLAYVAEIRATGSNDIAIPEHGLNIAVFTKMHKSKNQLAPFKLLGNQIYIQAALWASQMGFDDALIINEEHSIIEATSSNIFIVKNHELHTPAISEGCVGGIMRMVVINTAIGLGISVFESELKSHDLQAADEIFLTNSLRISWVGRFGLKRFYHKMSDQIITSINKIEQ